MPVNLCLTQYFDAKYKYEVEISARKGESSFFAAYLLFRCFLIGMTCLSIFILQCLTVALFFCVLHNITWSGVNHVSIRGDA